MAFFLYADMKGMMVVEVMFEHEMRSIVLLLLYIFVHM